MKIALKYFRESEFLMGAVNVAANMSDDFLLKLDTLRDLCGFPFHITSSFRTSEYNRRVGGSPGSFHLKGRAVDIACDNSEQRAVVLRHALNLGLTVGIMRTALHIDDREKQIVFHYYHKHGESKTSEND